MHFVTIGFKNHINKGKSFVSFFKNIKEILHTDEFYTFDTTKSSKSDGYLYHDWIVDSSKNARIIQILLNMTEITGIEYKIKRQINHQMNLLRRRPKRTDREKIENEEMVKRIYSAHSLKRKEKIYSENILNNYFSVDQVKKMIS
jgi:hypothetical protein